MRDDHARNRWTSVRSTGSSRANFDNVSGTTTQEYSGFVQDTWKIGSRLTINAGVRYEQQKLVGTDDEFTWDGNWAARIGGTFDMLGTGRSKIYATWGRFYAKSSERPRGPRAVVGRGRVARRLLRRRAAQSDSRRRPYRHANAGGSQSAVTRHLVAAGASLVIDPDSKSTYRTNWWWERSTAGRWNGRRSWIHPPENGPDSRGHRSGGLRPVQLWQSDYGCRTRPDAAQGASSFEGTIWETSSPSSRTHVMDFRRLRPGSAAWKIPSTTTTRSR